MVQAPRLLLVLLFLTACTAAPSAEVMPSESATESVPPSGPCNPGDEDAACVVWRRAGLVAASALDGFAVAAEPDGVLHGLDAATGETVWAGGVDAEVIGIATTDGLAYVSVEQQVVAVDVADGAERWRHQGTLVDPGRDGLPAVIAGDGVVYGVATGDGSQVWAQEAMSGFIGNAVGVDLVVISLETVIVAVDRSTGEERWRHDSAIPIFATVVTEDAVVASTASDGSEFDGYVILDADDGGLVAGRDDVSGAMVIEAEGHLVEVRFGQGARGIAGDTGEYTWDIPLGNAFFHGRRAFSLHDRALVLTADQDGAEVVAMIDAETGSQRWQIRADAQLEQVTLVGRYLALFRLGGITLHDPATGEPVLAVAVANGVVLGDEPLLIHDGDAVTRVMVP